MSVSDPETYKKYSAKVGLIVEKHGGVFLARGERCYHSAEYQAARQYTLTSSERHIVIVEGLQ